MIRVSAAKARGHFSDLVTRAGHRGERIVLTRNGKDLVALVSVEDLALLEAAEDRLDAEEADRILDTARPEDFEPWDKVKADLGL